MSFTGSEILEYLLGFRRMRALISNGCYYLSYSNGVLLDRGKMLKGNVALSLAEEPFCR